MWPGVVSGARVPLTVLALATLLAAGFGPVASGHGGGGESAPENEVVSLKGYRFTPDPIELHRDGSVTWRNYDGVVHRVVSTDGRIDSGDLKPGDSWEWTALAEGNVSYACAYHSAMKGSLTVLPPLPPNTPPEVKIVQPQDGATVSDYVTITGTSNDTDGDWLKVYVRVDGGAWKRIETSTLDWQIGWDTTVLRNGEHTLEAAAWDAHGDYSVVERVTVFVDNEQEDQEGRPRLLITEPMPRARVSGTLRVAGLAEDGSGDAPDVRNESDWVIRVRVDDGEWTEFPAVRNWETQIDTRNLTNGVHRIDAFTIIEGRSSPVSTVSVLVDNDAPDPIRMQITYPPERQRVSGGIEVRGSAYDPEGMPLQVFVRVDRGEWQQAPGENPWTYRLDTTTLSNGPHVIEAFARSETRSSATTKVTVFTENGEKVARPQVAITSPSENTRLSGTVLVRGTSENPSGRELTVQFRVNGGAWEPVSGTRQWAYTLDTTTLPNGVHHLQARAFDDQSYSDEYDQAVLVANAPQPVDFDDGDDDLVPLVPNDADTSTQSRNDSREESKGIPGPGATLGALVMAAAAGVARRRQ